jgi:hypothetical protein
MSDTVLGVRWFNNVGIVRVETEYEGIKYYIREGIGRDENEDVKLIAEWGSTFPTNAGDVLFGVK